MLAVEAVDAVAPGLLRSPPGPRCRQLPLPHWRQQVAFQFVELTIQHRVHKRPPLGNQGHTDVCTTRRARCSRTNRDAPAALEQVSADQFAAFAPAIMRSSREATGEIKTQLTWDSAGAGRIAPTET